ncbi:MAG: LruC domain-containing protein [Bacteroidetes bacterium]|nr:LruC domain-containing protein [Bacteroidota bacterium]
MKTIHLKRFAFTVGVMIPVMLVVCLSSCKKNSGNDNSTPQTIDQIPFPATFDWATARDVSFQITALDNTDAPIPSVRFDIYTTSPEQGGILLHSGITDANGQVKFTRPVPTYLTELCITNKYVGLLYQKTVPVTGNAIVCTFGGKTPNPGKKKSAEGLIPTGIPKVWVLGTYTSVGAPNYLESVNDVVSASLLNDINASFPEGQNVANSHPQYLTSTNETNLPLREQCDVWITYISSYCGFHNIVGFFTFNTNNPPSNPSQIDSIKVIWPNVALTGNSGGLATGNKVYLGRFPAGKSLGWVIFANGWNGSTITTGQWTFYSIDNLNPETNPNLKRHTILLRDPGRHQVLFAFEDWKRDEGSDSDFNDNVFDVTATPVSGVNTDNMPNIDNTRPDRDHDGVCDNDDDFPDDPTKCFHNYYPSSTGYGSLSFEDLWPGKGDYDLNDLVVSYRFDQITNNLNKVVEIKATLSTEAMGASFHNGFGILLPVPWNKIASVTGTSLQHGTISLNPNNTESGQTNAVIIAYDDAYDRLKPIDPGCGIGSNTTLGCPYVTPDVLNLDITLTEPIAVGTIGTPPYNPFIYVNQDRGREVHLPDKPPTDKANQTYFGTMDDNSNPATGRYYKTSLNLPWAFNLAEKFSYPIEKAPVNTAYLHFVQWAQSNGTSYTDWYNNTASGYRDNSKIYTH